MSWLFLVNQIHTAQPVKSDLQMNDSNKPVLFSESHTHAAQTMCNPFANK